MNKFLNAALKVSVASLMVAGLMSQSLAYTKGKTYKYTVLHVNDTHGHFYASAEGQGGFPAIKTIVDQVKKEGNPVVLLHAGDFNTGVPESDLLKAKPDVAGINLLGVDAVAVGNHEFDVVLADMKEQKKALKAPLLAANVLYADPKTGKTADFYPGYTTFKKGDLKFLVVSTVTPSTKYQSNPEHTAPFTFLDPAESALKTVKAAQKKSKADVVIALNHLGLYYKGEHGDAPYGDITFANKLPANTFSLIVSGHTHNFGCVDAEGNGVNWKPGMTCTPPVANGTPVVQAGRWGYYVGRADFEFKDGVSKMVNYELIPVNLKDRTKDAEGKTVYVDNGHQVAQDPKLLAELQKYQDQGAEQLKVTVGSLSDALTTTRSEQTKLGFLVAEAQRELTGSDIAIMNSGGIRAGLPQGNVSYRDVLIMQPFANSLATVKLTGKEVFDYLKTIAGLEGGGFPQYAGVTLDVKKLEGQFDAEKRQVVEISNVKVGGQPLDLNKTYQLSVLTFLAGGGDRYPAVNKLPSYVDTGYLDARAFADYLKAKGTIDVSKLEIQGATFQK